MSCLSSFEPKSVWKYFEAISAVPRGSGNMEGISTFMVNFAKEHNLEYHIDDAKNVVMFKKATPGYENADGIILQGHMDMVCEKTIDSKMDFLKDGLTLKTDGKFLFADGTTLGGDDGIAVAYILAILSDDSIPHPDLEAIITTDEEIGLIGAKALDHTVVKGRKLINIDSEEEGIILASCAGGMRLTGEVPYEEKEVKGECYEVTVTGLLGGHSGSEIDKGRANSNVLMARVLFAAYKAAGIAVARMEGGKKENAIARHSTAKVVVPCDKVDAFLAAIEKENKDISAEFTPADPDIKVTAEKLDCTSLMAAEGREAVKILNYVYNLPNGIQSMSEDIKGLVETSLNMGALLMENGMAVTHSSIRSSKETAKYALMNKVILHIEAAGGKHSISGDYPGWAFKKDSELRSVAVESFKEIYGHEPKVEAIHAGLECGLFMGKMPDLDCISIGPDMFDVHTYEERLDIASAQRTYDFVLRILKNSK